jgi:hypothetical protein
MKTPPTKSVTGAGLRLIGPATIIILAASGCSTTSNSTVAQPPPTSTGSYNPNNSLSAGGPNPNPAPIGSYNTNNNAAGGEPPSGPPGSYNTNNATSGAGPGGGSSGPLQFSGTGSDQSAQFLVNVNTVTAYYTYDCSAAGGSGDFSAFMVSGDPSSPNYDDQRIVDTSGSSSSATVTMSPHDVGSYYNLQITTSCSWSITLQAG